MKATAPSRSVRRTALPAACLLGALALAGCDGDGFANEPSPALTVTVTALVDDRRVSVSPTHIGGGLVRVIIANQSGEPQRVALRARGREEAPPTRTTEPIPVGGTGELELDLEAGTYRLDAVGSPGEDIRAGVLEVGAQRPATQSQLRLP